MIDGLSGWAIWDYKASLNGGTDNCNRPIRLAVVWSWTESGAAREYIIVVEPRESSPNPHDSKNILHNFTTLAIRF